LARCDENNVLPTRVIYWEQLPKIKQKVVTASRPPPRVKTRGYISIALGGLSIGLAAQAQDFTLAIIRAVIQFSSIKPPDIRIRKASAADLEAIIRLSAFVQQQHADALPDLFKASIDSQQTRDKFRVFLADPASLTLLAEAAQPIGYLWAQFQNRPEGWTQFGMRLLYIQHMVVAPQHRRKGVGRLLLARAIEIARQEGIKRVELDVWSFNSEARRFYTKQGFVVFNEKMALRTDAV
jgi:ribosomal protein S18 acetylase RimI-like enzyme